MPSTTPADFGDIVLVPFPFTDQTGAKRRPAVVVSATRLNVVRPDVVIMAVSSQARAGAGEIAIADWRGAGLLKPSVGKPVFATIARELILKPLGRLTAADASALRAHLRHVLG